MDNCKNGFYNDLTFTLVGRGDNEAEATRDLQRQLDEKLKDLQEKDPRLKCPGSCLSGLGDNEDPVKKCQFDYGPTTPEPKKEPYVVILRRSKEKKDRVALTQTFELGCFCF